MSKSTRKNWTRTMALRCLKDINEPLGDADKLAENGGKMPAALRNKLKNTVKKVEECKAAFEKWTPQRRQKYDKESRFYITRDTGGNEHHDDFLAATRHCAI